MRKFVNNLVAFSLKNSTFVFFLTAVLLVTGVNSYMKIPIEAFPDVTNTRARIITQWPGRSAEEVEKFITLPMMKEMNTIPGKTDVRSTSLFGLSVVTVLFDEKAEDRKITRLNSSHVAISYAVFCLKKKTQRGKMNKHQKN